MAMVAPCSIPLRSGKGKGKGKCEEDTASDTSDDTSDTSSATSTSEESHIIPAHIRQLRQSDSDPEAFDDSDTDSYLSVF